MAGTYYNYAERQADSQVNWFQVGKDLTDMLKKETESPVASETSCKVMPLSSLSFFMFLPVLFSSFNSIIRLFP